MNEPNHIHQLYKSNVKMTDWNTLKNEMVAKCKCLNVLAYYATWSKDIIFRHSRLLYKLITDD